MIVQTLVVGLLQTNCYIVGDEPSGDGAIVDPGGNAERIWSALGKLSTISRIRYVVNTHAHFDHVAGNGKLIQLVTGRQETPPQLVLHADDAPLLAADGGARLFGLQPISSPQPDLLVQDGDVLSLGQLTLQVLHTPGHSPGGISLYCAEAHALFSGDVLFCQGVGRWDLPGGDGDTLMRTIRERLFVLPDETTVYPGHGPPTTIGQEKRGNPYIY